MAQSEKWGLLITPYDPLSFLRRISMQWFVRLAEYSTSVSWVPEDMISGGAGIGVPKREIQNPANFLSKL